MHLPCAVDAWRACGWSSRLSTNNEACTTIHAVCLCRRSRARHRHRRHQQRNEPRLPRSRATRPRGLSGQSGLSATTRHGGKRAGCQVQEPQAPSLTRKREQLGRGSWQLEQVGAGGDGVGRKTTIVDCPRFKAYRREEDEGRESDHSARSVPRDMGRRSVHASGVPYTHMLPGAPKAAPARS